jgi:hypothetical protein
MVDFFYWDAEIFNSLPEMEAAYELIENTVNVKYVHDPITGRYLMAWGGPLDIEQQ